MGIDRIDLVRRATTTADGSAASSVASTESDPSATTTTTTTSGSSFIGNTPSTVLFFIALAVGVCIALLFIYFTLRYFVKTKFGVYIPSHAYQGRPMAHPVGRMGPGGRYVFTGGYNTLSNLNDFAEYALHRDYNALLAVRERRLQRRRYRRKRKLTKDEVDQLFPIKTYSEWENGGKEDDIERAKGLILHENEAENVNHEEEVERARLDREIESKAHEIAQGPDSADATEHDETDITDLSEFPSTSKTAASAASAPASAPAADADADVVPAPAPAPAETAVDITNINDELHFSSGTCAICLDTLDDDDQVRGLICGHVFHQECIDPWLINRKACCPMCKRDYYMKDQNGDVGTNDEDGDGMDGESLVPLDSIADFILPRPISYRARELLDYLDAHENNTADASGTGNNNNTVDSADDVGDNGIGDDADLNGEPNADNSPDNDPDNDSPPQDDLLRPDGLGSINIQDLIGIREAVAAKLPRYWNIFQRLFWRIMGITRENLQDYLVVKIYEDRRMERISRDSAANQTADQNAPEEIELTETPNRGHTTAQDRQIPPHTLRSVVVASLA